jgi:rhodanese-related sulfurtransferase
VSATTEPAVQSFAEPAAVPTAVAAGVAAAVAPGTGVPTCPANLRDVASTVPAVVPGVLLRSDAPLPGDTAPDGVAWPPRTVVDLRDPGEAAHPHPLRGAAVVLDLPVLDGLAWNPREQPPGMGALYLTMLGGVRARRLVEAVTAVATGEGPVLVHCSAGKDRTGVTVALALTLAGVPRADVISDYERTTANMSGVVARMALSVRRPEGDRSFAEPSADLLSAPRPVIESVLDALERHSGGAAGWFLAHGGDGATIGLLRERLLGA